MQPDQPRPEHQELYCHACDRYVQFVLDMSINGNHVLNCPNCGHEHCRVVQDGVITDDRWDSRNTVYVRVSRATFTATSVVGNFLNVNGTTASASTYVFNTWGTSNF